MSKPLEDFQNLRLSQVQTALEKHFFKASVHQTLPQALDYLTDNILDSSIVTVGFGGSDTVGQSDLLDRLKKLPQLEVIDRNNPQLTPAERQEYSRRCLTADLFIASTNAVTLSGELVNIDKFGNRVAAMIFGPKKVALIAGRNKICQSPEDAKLRVKNVAAPVNALRLGLKTPCTIKGVCGNCQGDTRICGVFTVIERSFPPGRIHVLLVNEDLGF